MSTATSALLQNIRQNEPIGALSRSVRADLGLSQERLGRLLDLSYRTVSRWESGVDKTNGVQSRDQLRLSRLHSILEHLPENMLSRDRLQWLTVPNRKLESGTPIDLIASDSGARIVRKLAQKSHIEKGS